MQPLFPVSFFLVAYLNGCIMEIWKDVPGYNPERVAVNNARRKFWADCPEPEHYPLSYDGADFDQWGDCEFGIHD